MFFNRNLRGIKLSRRECSSFFIVYYFIHTITHVPTYLHAFASIHTRMPMKCTSAHIGSRLNFERRSADEWSKYTRVDPLHESCVCYLSVAQM